MLYLSKKDIEKSFSMSKAIEAAKNSLAIYSKGEAIIPLRVNLGVEKFNGQSLFMPGATKGEVDAVGVKIVSVYPDNINKGLPSVPATMVVIDAKTGIVSAILDGTFLTQLRTGAVQGAATDLLARQDAKIGLIIGTGGQALQQSIAMLTVRKLRTFYVSDIDLNRAKTFAKQLYEATRDHFTTNIIVADDLSKAVQEADVITTVTTSKVATFNFNDVKPGTHINGIGAYTPEMHELPISLIEHADCIFLDTKDGVLSEAGDIITPLQQGKINEKNITGELGELVLEKVDGRQNETDITVFKTVGTAVLDIVTAQLIVENANEKGLGLKLE
ncbi:ornithine cyclodeaminase family protein [Streptococcus pacificus]|uniref:Ornithine cyclodeaminase family protein n=1 Tax=Streptococcus pacificus TaxID=2740577 RepID=A0ABS0ZI58_9STRE|nr:ornithine cyclodeaminase family protein [Streptococcus pacificus]MBJ8325632.1 ornithine cyclodeaminase family protein [Streptococcus pacificus]